MEDFAIQELIPHFAVKRFDVAILPRIARLNLQLARPQPILLTSNLAAVRLI